MPTPNQIRELLQTHGLSMRQAAELLGVSPRTVESWVQGLRNMPDPMWRLLNILLE